MPISLTCPSCDATLRVADHLAGRKIRCPKCEAVVAVSDDAGEQAVATKPVRAAAAAPLPDLDDEELGSSRRRYEEDDGNFEEERPRKKKKQRKQQSNALLIGLIVGGGLLLIGGAVVLIIILAGGDGDTKKGEPLAQKPAFAADMNKAGMPGGGDPRARPDGGGMPGPDMMGGMHGGKPGQRIPRPGPAPKPGRPAQKGLAGTTWVGTETLPGYGRLEFQLGEDGQATMIDAKDTVQGTYSITGNAITLDFGAVYTGVISGRTMAGTARDGKNRPWKWSVKQQ